MTTQTQYEPLSAEEIQAWQNCRFVTTNIERTHAIGCTNSVQTWGVLKKHLKSNLDAPSGPRCEGVMEFEVRSTHPEVLAVAAERREQNTIRPTVWPWDAPKAGPFGARP